MNYELAKKLKEVKFHKLIKDTRYCETDGKECTESSCYPTLSELIEACGDRFGELGQYDREKRPGWIVHGHEKIWDSDEPGHIRVEGSTPEEAVALLWLELNKK